MAFANLTAKDLLFAYRDVEVEKQKARLNNQAEQQQAALDDVGRSSNVKALEDDAAKEAGMFGFTKQQILIGSVVVLGLAGVAFIATRG